MAKERKKTNNLYGLILRSSISKGSLISVKLPEMSPAFTIIGAEDLIHSNRIRFIDNYIPLLVKDEISYKGQPILVLFGPDYESVNYYLKKIQLKYSEDVKTVDKPNLAPIEVSWGDTNSSFEDKNLVQIKTESFSQAAQTEDYSNLRVSAWMEGDTVFIRTPCQWLFHIKDSVAETLAIPKKNIIVKNTKYYAPNDELLTTPSFFANMVALAAKKTGKEVEIRSIYPVYKPEIKIRRTTTVSKDAKPISERISVTIDQGAFPLFSYELSYQILAGLIPEYPLESLKISISTQSSSNPPSNFFGGLGFSTALASRETHSSNIAKHFLLSPAKFKMENLLPSENYNKFIKTLETERLTKMITKICDNSSYERKEVVNTIQQANKTRLKSLLSYSRGIGFASGPGVSGFTNRFQYRSLYGIELILKSKNKLIINSNCQEENSVTKIWKTIISNRFSLDEENISFLSLEDPDLMDTGPQVLSRDIGPLAILIIEACKDIIKRQKTEDFPISSRQFLNPDEKAPLFFSNVWCAVIIELEIHPVYLVPLVKSCWASFDFDKVFDKSLLSSSIRRIIESTLMDLGSSKNSDLKIELEITDKGKTTPSSASSVIKALVTSAFNSALNQALGSNISTLPITSQDILRIVKGIKNDN
ncbi:MAG: molybdopterin cofactor-binding domain-containing protein [Sphaerochaetaceae bacterium]